MNIEVPVKFKEIASEAYHGNKNRLAADYIKMAKEKGWRVMSVESVKIHLSQKTTYIDMDLYNYIFPSVEDYVAAKKRAKKLVEDLMAVA